MSWIRTQALMASSPKLRHWAGQDSHWEIHARTHTRMHARMHAHTHAHTHTHARTHAHTHARTHTHTALMRLHEAMSHWH